ncbi:hypothetical protein CEXT_590631 [Caerostris extrusa]|uniref:Uncharacterized protein n=1 Tax=Caerostris extrusa TaxID=172846 RepID=A0AAV4XG97_CAEEX|nr:hypothetical protein CEXT_590631 [Caerostris extrusa]
MQFFIPARDKLLALKLQVKTRFRHSLSRITWYPKLMGFNLFTIEFERDFLLVLEQADFLSMGALVSFAVHSVKETGWGVF